MVLVVTAEMGERRVKLARHACQILLLFFFSRST